MKSAVVYVSIHHGNTKKIAEAIAAELGADLYQVNEIGSIDFSKYTVIALGSGIFHGKHHGKILEAAASKAISDKNIFIFSTSGMGSVKYHTSLKAILDSRCANIVGEFACKGYDTYGFFKWIGGIAKGRPNMKDITDIRKSLKRLKTTI